VEDITKAFAFFIVIGLPMILIFGQPMIRRWIALREKKLELEMQMTAEKAAQYAAHTERLEQRVRVLERIVTDKGIVVADQIDALRDKPLN
jgi:hypothetical protein